LAKIGCVSVHLERRVCFVCALRWAKASGSLAYQDMLVLSSLRPNRISLPRSPQQTVAHAAILRNYVAF